jgi:hemolysin III
MAGGERFNAVTHLIGALLTAAGMIALVMPPILQGEYLKALWFTVYGTSLLLTYVASILFHSMRGRARETYRRFDRIAIYILIAGTYTPLTLLRLPPRWGVPMLLAVWALAISGAVVEFLLSRKKKPLSVTLYVAMGWISILAVKPLLASITVYGVLWMVAGGVLYSLGALMLRWKLHPRCHEIWHVVVLVASACHFAMMYLYVS